MIEKVFHNDTMLAMIVRADYDAEGIQFFTPDTFSQQLGYMKRPPGYIVRPHVHMPVMRSVEFTKEVLIVRKGRMRVDFYDDQQNYLESKILKTGDIILLAFGGHGIEMLEETVLLEVKQGPYAGPNDKVRFDPLPTETVIFKKPV